MHSAFGPLAILVGGSLVLGSIYVLLVTRAFAKRGSDVSGITWATVVAVWVGLVLILLASGALWVWW